MLPDGAIFCGECGRAVTAAASRRPAAQTPVEQAPPPPLQQPDVHGRRHDPATDAWLPEATLDPATRAWLTGRDQDVAHPPTAVPVQRPDGTTPRTAPSHVHGAASGLADWSAPESSGADVPPAPRAADVPPAPSQPEAPRPPHAPQAPQVPSQPEPAEPPLDPNAYPSEPEDTEVTRLAERDAPEAAAPVWSPPQEPVAPVAPAGPSWWVGRPNARTASTDTEHDTPSDGREETEDGADADRLGAPAVASPPQANDTAVVEPLVDRRPSRPTPLVAPGNQTTTCHVCGHELEPDDIFCSECGAVRPAVTAAFTGQIVPLPMDRPDWAADDSVPDEVADGSAPDHAAAADVAADDAVSAGAADDAGPAGAADDAAVSAGAADDADAAVGTTPDAADERATDAAEPDDSVEPVEEDTPRAPLRPRGVHAAPATDDPQLRVPVDPAVIGPAPGSATHPSSAPSAPDTVAIGVPAAAPLPPVPGVTGPVLPLVASDSAPTSAEGDLDEDVDETRIVSKTPTRAPFVLHFSTGERFGVHGTGLVGRLPRPQPGERFDDLLTVHDPGKSVSKTHLELGRDGDDLWVSDRFSGNGTVVRHIDGSIRRCEPGRRYRVERGARVDIGEQFFLVQ